jgi:hypothetical protein
LMSGGGGSRSVKSRRMSDGAAGGAAGEGALGAACVVTDSVTAVLAVSVGIRCVSTYLDSNG